MKKNLNPTNNIKFPERVKLSPEDYWQAGQVENNPEAMLRLIDLIFGPGGWMDSIPS